MGERGSRQEKLQHLCRHPPLNLHGLNCHCEFPFFWCISINHRRLMIELLEEQVNSVVHSLYRELHSDHRSSTFFFNWQLLASYFICIVSVLPFCYHDRLSIIFWEEVLKQNLTNLHFTNLHFLHKSEFSSRFLSYSDPSGRCISNSYSI